MIEQLNRMIEQLNTMFPDSQSLGTTILVIALAVLAVIVGVAIIRMARAQRALLGSNIDPVCGVRVDPAFAEARYKYNNRIYTFCSNQCMAKFVEQIRSAEASARPEDRRTAYLSRRLWKRAGTPLSARMNQRTDKNRAA